MNGGKKHVLIGYQFLKAGEDMLHGGCWIFLSHASKDIELVRRVRNEFEKYGQNPLAFHLRCLDEEYPRKEEELWDLIYREIDAREWFIYCKSPEAENSDNVLRERQYIEQSGKNKIWMLDMTEEWDAIATKIHKICADLEVFISYAHHDRKAAEVLRTLLIEKDYSVWTAEDNLNIGDCWETQISKTISRCAEQGFYVLLISEDSLKSQFVEKELEYATSQGAWIIPVVIGDTVLPQWLENWLGQYFRISEQTLKTDFEKVIAMIDSGMIKKIRNISQG